MKFYTIFRESSDPQERKKGLARQRRQIARFAAFDVPPSYRERQPGQSQRMGSCSQPGN